MRIVGGELRGRALTSPEGRDTRPTSDRARESVFNILGHAGWANDAVYVLDAFAGTGALGLEALSRGAAHAVFIEQDRKAAGVCRENIDKLGVGARSALLTVDALNPPVRPLDMAPRDLVFLDPPYGKGLGVRALEALDAKGWLADGAVAVMEMSKKAQEEMPKGFEMKDERKYGIALVRFFVKVS